MKNLFLITILILTTGACQNQAPRSSENHAPSKTMSQRAPFIHTVFFYLYEEVTDEQKTAFEAGMEKLGTCPTIANYRIGKPAMTPREIVDNNYDYCWIVEFETSVDQDAYQVEPIHLEFVELYQNLWKDVKVYDSIMMD